MEIYRRYTGYNYNDHFSTVSLLDPTDGIALRWRLTSRTHWRLTSATDWLTLIPETWLTKTNSVYCLPPCNTVPATKETLAFLLLVTRQRNNTGVASDFNYGCLVSTAFSQTHHNTIVLWFTLTHQLQDVRNELVEIKATVLPWFRQCNIVTTTIFVVIITVVRLSRCNLLLWVVLPWVAASLLSVTECPLRKAAPFQSTWFVHFCWHPCTYSLSPTVFITFNFPPMSGYFSPYSFVNS
jgi:hypothetical protein